MIMRNVFVETFLRKKTGEDEERKDGLMNMRTRNRKRERKNALLKL